DTAAMAPGGSLILEGITIDDPESAATGTTVSVLAIALTGTLTLSQSQGVAVPGDSTDTAYLPMFGTLEDVNAALATLRFRPGRAYTGVAEVWVYASDLVEVGPNDRQRSDLHIIRITVG
ncbi:MAG: hypothetical protein L0221_04325, partial [Chloroflexi bacterium]|nr:hypothetical protein [Chloroflexota bacterium]